MTAIQGARQIHGRVVSGDCSPETTPRRSAWQPNNYKEWISCSVAESSRSSQSELCKVLEAVMTHAGVRAAIEVANSFGQRSCGAPNAPINTSSYLEIPR